MKYYLLLMLTIVLSSTITGQSTIKYCEFEMNPSYKDNVKEALSIIGENSNLGLTSIPVALTFLMKSDSTSSYYDGLEQSIMDSISSHFLPIGLHFYLAESPVFIYEDLVYNFIVGENIELIYPGIKSNRINIVIANSISLDNGGGVCGLAQVYNTTVLIRYSCIPSNTISHEIGHELGLAHTHYSAIGVELVDGSNCATAGDLICDTPADPNRIDLVSNDCEWEGTYEDQNGYDIDLVDANGDVYMPDVSNLMSYYGGLRCRNDFTFLQSLVMHKRVAQKLPIYGYETPKMAFDIYKREDLCDDGYAVSARVKNEDSNVDYQWDFDSDGVVDQSGIDAQYLYTEYGNYTIKLIMTYPDGRQFYQSKICIIEYSNESIVAPFLDDYNEKIEREHVSLVEETPFKWNLNLHLTNERVVAADQIHINENSIMEYKVDISDIDQAVLEFEYDCNTNANTGGDTLLIELLTCDESIVIFEKWGKNLGTDGEYVTISLPLPAVTSDIVSLRFTTKGDAQQWHDIYIDNLQVYENSISGIEHFSNEELKIFPNPTRSSIEIQTDLNLLKVHLIDMYGNILDTYDENTKIDLSNLSTGIYFIKAFAGEKWYVHKIFKSN